MKNKVLLNILHSFLVSTIAFILIPLYMIGNSPDDFHFIDFNIFFKSAVAFSIILGVTLSLIVVVFHVVKFEKITTIYSTFIYIWIIVAGLFLPLSLRTGMVEPEYNPADFVNVAIVIVIATIFSAIKLTKYKEFIKYINLFLSVVLLTSIPPGILSIYNSEIFITQSLDHPSLSLSNKKNILVVSFDGMPGRIISDILKSNKFYAEELKDFIVFENAVSQSPATSASLMGEMYGMQDFKSKGETLSKAKKTLVNEGFDKILIAKHISDSYQYGYAGFQINRIAMSSSATNKQYKIDTFEFFKYPIVRLWTSYSLNFLSWEKTIFKIQQYIIDPKTTLGVENTFKDHKGAKWDLKYTLDINIFDSLVSKISTKDKDFSIRYMHLVFTHFPVDFDEKCNYRSNDEVWFKSHQNEKGIREQGVCAVGKFVKFIQKLKHLGIYNKSLIVFKSDHGEPVTYFSKYPDNLLINKNKLSGYNRYRPTLMIKDFEANNLKNIFKTEQVFLNDLAKTLCEASGINIECKKFNGVNLLDGSLESNEPYYIYVPKNSKSSYRYEDHISIKIPSRKTSLLQGMKNSSLIELSEPDLHKILKN